jgi:hypothetical protein
VGRFAPTKGRTEGSFCTANCSVTKQKVAVCLFQNTPREISTSLWFTRIFGPKREVTGDWRKLHNEEFRNLYSSPNIIRMIKSRRMRWARHVTRMGEKRNAYRILVGKQKEALGRPRRR